MKIYSGSGFEYEKKLSTSFEDLFNQSDVIYDFQGEKRKLSVTYVRYFDQYMQEQQVYDPEQTQVPFYHLVAILILMKNNGYVDAERLYYNDTQQFLQAFNQDDIQAALNTYKSLQ